MRFGWKVLLCTLLVIVLSLGTGGTILVLRNFATIRDQEAASAQEENLLFSSVLITAAANAGTEAAQSAMAQAGAALVQSAQDGWSLRLYDDGGQTVWEGGATADASGLGPLEGGCLWRIFQQEEAYYLQVARAFTAGEDRYTLETTRDVSGLFAARQAQFATLRWVMAAAQLGGALLMGLLSYGVTRPVRQLSAAARRMARGEYAQRVKVRGHDEIGELTENFDAMAQALEEKIQALEQVARQREEFVASFAHELKTPLTAMIGYADMIRSQQMDPEKAFRAANYIFTEGRRLESLSLKLLELTVMRRQDFSFRWTSTVWLIEGIQGFLEPVMEQYGMRLVCTVEEAGVYVDPDLIKTLLMNLVDNARKASESGSEIDIHGGREASGYRVTVTDHGRGIPQEELSKITEAFYMVDKSRARAQNGAGLGLALCQQIAEAHQTKLEFASRLGEGTQVSIVLRMAQRQRRSRRGGGAV